MLNPAIQRLIATALVLWGLALIDALPAVAQSRAGSLTDPAQCTSNRYVTMRSWARRDVDIALAVCASGAPVGSAGYINFWRSIARACASGQEPKALWDVIERVSILNSNFYQLECEHVFKLVKRLDIPIDLERDIRDREASLERKKQVQQELRRNANGGSPTAKLMLASSLLDLESADYYRGPTTLEGLAVLAALARDGFANEVAKYVAELERKYPASPTNGQLHTLYLHIYGGLASANDPRGHVRLAEEKLRVASVYGRQNDREGMISQAHVARRYLDSARSKATGDLRKHVDKLDRFALEIVNSPTAAHVMTSLMLSSIGFVGTWQQAGGAIALKRVEDCRLNRLAADVDPNLRLAFSAFGCFAY